MYSLFNLDEWNSAMNLHPRTKSSLKEKKLSFIYGMKSPNLKSCSYSLYLAFKNKQNEWTEDRADYIFCLIGDWMKTEKFKDLIYELEKKILETIIRIKNMVNFAQNFPIS